MDRRINKAVYCIGDTLRRHLIGDVLEQHDLRELIHALDQIESATDQEQDMGREAKLLKQAETVIVEQRQEITDLKAANDAAKAQADKDAQTIKDLQAKLDAAGTPVDPTTIKDAEDVTEEDAFDKLLNPPAIDGSGTATASLDLHPAQASQATNPHAVEGEPIQGA